MQSTSILYPVTCSSAKYSWTQVVCIEYGHSWMAQNKCQDCSSDHAISCYLIDLVSRVQTGYLRTSGELHYLNGVL